MVKSYLSKSDLVYTGHVLVFRQVNSNEFWNYIFLTLYVILQVYHKFMKEEIQCFQ